MREFALDKPFVKPIRYGHFSISNEGDDMYTIRQYDYDGKIEDTLHFTREQLRTIFYLISKEADNG